MTNECKKCLLMEAGEKNAYQTVKDYLDNLDEKLKVSDEVYKTRLSFCKSCDFLLSGMCRKCGCYVEIRAALKDKECANFDDKKWR
ncbi:MAG: tetraprenyl-beta-curcumene synthase family protein [Clostridiales bacterium]|nr:tetraprenyl-beta-curcumene synthase family protein [Clostridiales bacterium]